jgi:undecaprenyl-diphosphatase
MNRMAETVPFLAFGVLFLILWGGLRVAGPLLYRLLRGAASYAARRIVRHRYEAWKVWFPAVAILLGAFLLAVVAGVTFVELAEDLQEQSEELERADTSVHHWFRSRRDDAVIPFFTAFTILGKPVSLAILVAIVSVPLLIGKRYRWLLYLLVTTMGGGILNVLLKAYFSRARPDLADAVLHASGYSFPSGHAMASTAVFGALAYLGMRSAKSWNEKSAILALAATTVLTIAASRLYLGVHWISDVIGGLGAGGLWLAGTTGAYETVRRIRGVTLLRRSV